MVDIQTLLLASSTARLGFVLIFLIASLKSDTRVAFRYWSASIFGSAIGMLLTYTDPHYPYFRPLPGTVTYVFLGFSVACIWAGARAFFGCPAGRTWVVALGVAPGLTYGASHLLGLHRDVVLLLTIVALTCSMTISAHTFLRRRARPYLPSQLLVGIAVSIYSLALAASAIAIVVKLHGPDLTFDQKPSEIYISLFTDQLMSVLTYVGLVAMSLEDAQMRTRALAMTDPLTALSNRLGVHEQVLEVIAGRRRSMRPLAVLIADLDHCKSINDRYGHASGDAVLREFARRLSAISRREQDVVGRWGGEEFLIVMTDTTLPQAITFAERVCRRASEAPFDLGAHTITVTVSIGVAAVDDDATNLEEAVRQADTALYEAKRHGRNRVGTRGPMPAA